MPGPEQTQQPGTPSVHAWVQGQAFGCYPLPPKWSLAESWIPSRVTIWRPLYWWGAVVSQVMAQLGAPYVCLPKALSWLHSFKLLSQFDKDIFILPSFSFNNVFICAYCVYKYYIYIWIFIGHSHSICTYTHTQIFSFPPCASSFEFPTSARHSLWNRISHLFL